jgi:hypothetical protein
MRPFGPGLLTLAFISGAVASIGCAVQSATASQPAGITLVEGKIAVTREEGSVSDGPGHVTLEKIPDDIAFRSEALKVKIPGTGFVVLLVDGKVTPVLIQEHPREVWRISGMRFNTPDHDITQANRIEPGDGQLKLILDGGDIWEVWTLDFTDPKKGLQIRYRDGSGW